MSSTTFPSLDVMVANVADQLGVEFVYIWDGAAWVTMDLTLNADFSFETVLSD
jgi:hypothetical protein